MTSIRPSANAAGDGLAVGLRQEAVALAPDDEGGDADAVQAARKVGGEVAGLPDEARGHTLIPDCRVFVHLGRAVEVFEEESGALVRRKDEIVEGRIAGDVDAGGADDDERSGGRAAYDGFEGEPPAEARANEGGGAVLGQRAYDVGDNESVVFDGLGPFRALGVPEAGQLDSGDVECLGEYIEEGRPRGAELIVNIEDTRAASTTDAGDGHVGEFEGEAGRSHQRPALIASRDARFKRLSLPCPLPGPPSQTEERADEGSALPNRQL